MNDLTPPTNPAPAGESPAFSAGAPTPPPRRKWLTPTLALVAVLVVGVFGGVLIGHATASSAQGVSAGGFSRGLNGGGGTGGAGGAGFGGGGFTSGTIVSVSGSTMVVKAQDGTQKTVTIASSTRVTKTSSASVSDLKAGQTVTVIGATGSNGDIAATSVSEGARGFGGRLGGGAGSGSGSGGSTNG
ncbi:hypothetical protein ACVXZ4_13540 [Lacisediminihabitans sp. FW035]